MKRKALAILLTLMMILSAWPLTAFAGDTAGNLNPDINPAINMDNWIKVENVPTTYTIEEATYGNDKFVAVGYRGTVLTSLDGSTWQSQAPLNSGNGLNSVIYGNGLFRAVGGTRDVYTSNDGINWNTRDWGVDNYLFDAAFGEDNFIVVGMSGWIKRSPDNGLSWSNGMSDSTKNFTSVVYGLDSFITVGQEGVIYRSIDSGANWSKITSGTSQMLSGVTYGNNGFVAVGKEGTILSSPDGVIWTSRNSGTLNDLFEVVYDYGLYVAVGELGTILTSADGVSWTSRNSGTEAHLFGIASGNGIFVVTGTGGTILRTTGLPDVCAIGETHYGTLKAALDSVTEGQTIQLLRNIDYNEGIIISHKSITLDLNGHTLAVTNASGIGLEVTGGGSVNLSGSGSFNVTGTTGVAVNAAGSAVVTNATGTAVNGYGVYVYGVGSTVAVKGDTMANASSAGVYVNGGGSVTIDGNVQGGSKGILAMNNSTVRVHGDAEAIGQNGTGAAAESGAVIYIDANVAAQETGATGVAVDGQTSAITVGGNINACGVGVYTRAGTITVGGNITAADEITGTGAIVYGAGKVTVDGLITAIRYLKINNVIKNEGIDSRTIPSTKDGYHTYTDAEGGTVWVKAADENGSSPPAWPNGSALTASSTTKTRTTLNWTAAADDAGVTGYRIYQNDALLQTVTGSIYSCEVTGLSSSTTYTFRVQAGDVDNNWTNGPTVTVHTSSSSGRNTTTPTLEVKPAAQVLDSNGTGNGFFTPKLDISTGTASVEVDSASLNSAFDKSKPDDQGIKTIAVYIPKIDGAKAYEPTLPASFLTAGDASIAVEIKTNIAVVTVPGNMLFGADTANAQKVSLTIAAGDKNKLEAAAQAQIGDRPMIELDLKIDGKQTSWNNESAPVTVTIPYTPSAEELLNLEHITVWYIDGSGKIVPVPSGKYDPAKGLVTFETTHFSNYVVAYVIGKKFNDLVNVSWAKQPIEVLASKGILQGKSEKEFAPNSNITRADFLYLLVRTLGVDVRVNGNFQDINSNAYYYKEIGIAKKLGITSGTGNQKFSPEASISRQDMIVLTERALRMLKKLKSPGSASDLEKFTDKSLISGYARDSVASVIKEGLIVGNGDKVNPLSSSTRAEAAVFLYRIYNIKNI